MNPSKYICLALCWWLACQSFAETRWYFARGGNLPTDAVSVDLRPETGLTELQLDNIYANPQYDYPLYDKPADSWWGYTLSTRYGKKVDLSAVTPQCTLCLKLKTTVSYDLHLVVCGTGTVNAKTINSVLLPRDGKWHILRIPLSDFPATALNFTDKMTGKLFQIHADGGVAGDILGIDYIYITDNTAQTDGGSVAPEKRYYCISNPQTPPATDYTAIDCTPMLHYAATPWLQPSYVPFPYLLLEEPAADAQFQIRATKEGLPWTDVNQHWYFTAKIYKTCSGAINVRISNTVAEPLVWTLPDDELPIGKWTTIALRMADLTDTLALPVVSPRPIVSISMESLSQGVLSIAYAFFCNTMPEADPTPIVPRDPSKETRIYLVNDGTPLPEELNCEDYRAGVYDGTEVLFNNNMTRDLSVPYLSARTRTDQNSWWSIDLRARQSIDLSKVDATWNLFVRLRTETTHRPVNLILYQNGSGQRYPLNEEMLPTAPSDQWHDFSLPLTAFLAGGTTLNNYQGSANVFSLHADGSGRLGALCAIEQLYFFHNNSEIKPDSVSAFDTHIVPDTFAIVPPVSDALTYGTEGQYDIRYSDRQLHIFTSRPNMTLHLYSLLGTRIEKIDIEEQGYASIPLNLPTGQYIVRLQSSATAREHYTCKIVVRQ